MKFRIQLKLPTKEDMDYIRWLWSDPETMQPVGGPVLYTDIQAERWFEYMIDPGRPTECYRLILSESSEPVGEVSFHDLDLDDRTAMFNLKIAHSSRGKGYGREAMILFLDQYFNEMGGEVMLDDIALDNDRGQEVLLRFGFKHDPSEEEVYKVLLTREEFNNLYIV